MIARTTVMAIFSGTVLALAGCGGSSGGGVAGGGWSGTKACDVLKKADVEAVTGLKAEDGKLDGVHEASGGSAAMSMCSYTLGDGKVVSLLTRVSSGEGNLAGQIAAIKNPPAGMSMGPQQDVSGIGQAALWNDATHQLQFWIDADHFGVLSFVQGDFAKKPDFGKAKDQAIALSHKIGG